LADPANILTPLLMLVSSLLSPPPPPAPPPPAAVDDAEARQVLECVGRYESNGNYLAVSKSGRNRGKYQMTTDFFTKYGGDPQYAGKHELAPPRMQDVVALNGYKARGLDPWPGTQEVCK
jgi:transglycosylase-like protein